MQLIFHPGTIIFVQIGPVRHVGIVTERVFGSEQCVISNSNRKGFAAEEPLSVFSGGRQIQIQQHPTANFRYAVANARRMLGRPWSLLDNCEHFISRAFGDKPNSKQLKNFIILAAVSLVFWRVMRK